MQPFPIHYSADRFAPFPPVASLPVVEAESALDAARLALKQFPPTLTEPEIWCRVILTVHPDGSPRHALRVPLTAERMVPINWVPPFE